LFSGYNSPVTVPAPHKIIDLFLNRVLPGRGVNGQPLVADYGVKEALGHWGFSSVQRVNGNFVAKALKSEDAGKWSNVSFGIAHNNKDICADFGLDLASLLPPSTVEDLVVFKDFYYSSVKEKNNRMYFSAGVDSTVGIEETISAVGKRLPWQTSSAKNSRLPTVVVANPKLSTREWNSHGSQVLTLEASYLQVTKGIATLKKGDIAKSFPVYW
jgi:hypothetical protein